MIAMRVVDAGRPRTLLNLISSASVLALLCGAQAATAQSTGQSAPTAPPSGQGPGSTLSADQPATIGDSQTDDETDDDIIVTGIRASLANSQEIKRRSDTVVDAITAEDIGALPDRSINEALQRIPGVAITRFASANDAQHFSVEGSGVVIRGLGYVRGEFNGRDTFSANGGREIGFNDVAPELVGSVEVFKNLTADLIEGGISGTVNLNTRKPFDAADRQIYLSAEMNYGDLERRGAPTFTGLFSDQWQLGDGSRIGLLASATYSKLYSRTDSAHSFAPTERFNGTRVLNAGTQFEQTVTDTFPLPAGFDTVYAPYGGGYRTQSFDRERIGLAAAAQFESADEVFLATAQFLRTDGRNSWSEHTIEPNVWYPDRFATFPGAGSSYTFDEDGVFTSGRITQPGVTRNQGWNRDIVNPDGTIGFGTLPYLAETGLFTFAANRGFIVDSKTDDYSLNFKVTPNDRLRLNFDGQFIKSTVRERDFIIDTATFSNITLDYSDEVPSILFDVSPVPNYGGVPDTADYFANPESFFFRDAFQDWDDNDGEEWAFRGDVEYDVSDVGFIRRLRAGARYSDRDQIVRNNNYNNWGSLGDTWTTVTNAAGQTIGGGPVTYADIDPSNYELFAFENFFRGATSAPPLANFLRGNIAEDYDVYADLLRQITDLSGGNFNLLEDRTAANTRAACGTKIMNTYCADEIFVNSERTIAGYARVDFGTTFGTMEFDGNVGLRYVNTRDDAVGFLNIGSRNTVLPDQFATFEAYCNDPTRPPDNPLPPVCTLSGAEQQALLQFFDGASFERTTSNQFDHWLPSLNLRLAVTPELQFRFAASKAISRPPFRQLRSTFGVGVAAGTGGSFGGLQAGANGNPFLEPIEATQFDLTGEWYFSRVGSLTVALFYKELDNFILDTSQSLVEIENNGQTYPVLLNGPANSDESGDIKGFELAYQQTYDFLPGALAGLGLQASYTYVDPGSLPPPSRRAVGDAGQAPGGVPVDVSGIYEILPIPNLSKHNVNIAGFYDRNGLYARVAYSWRSRFLLNIQDEIFPFLPTYSEATGQVDASIFYSVNDQFKIGIQGSNLLNETTRTTYVLNGDGLEAPRARFINDRRFALSVRLTL